MPYHPTLRLVIASLTGAAVLVVAATVLAVASTLFANAASSVGQSYVRALVRGARDQATSYFEAPVADMTTLAAELRLSREFVLPSERQALNATSFCAALRIMHRASNYSYNSIGIFFDDGSIATSPLHNVTQPYGPIIQCTMTSAFNRTNSAAKPGRRSYWPPAKRHSITRFFPST